MNKDIMARMNARHDTVALTTARDGAFSQVR
jgi:hypothetical protein